MQLQAAGVALKAAGYEVAKGAGAHQRTIESLRLTIEDDGNLVDTLQQCRARRGGGIYETTGIASEAEVQELRELRELQPLIAQALSAILDQFYAHLVKYPRLAGLFPYDATIRRAKQAQFKHWSQIARSLSSVSGLFSVWSMKRYRAWTEQTPTMHALNWSCSAASSANWIKSASQPRD